MLKFRKNENERRIYEMIISERIFNILEKKNMSQNDFSKKVGIANSTISDWKRKKTNPSADRIMDICYVLDVTPEQLLTGKGIDDVTASNDETVLTPLSKTLLEDFNNLQDAQKDRLLEYVEALKKIDSLEGLV